MNQSKKESFVSYWYDWPMQARYLYNDNYKECIVYQDFVIDLCSGAPIKIEDIYYQAQLNNIDIDDAIIEWGDWKDLSKI